MSNRGHVVGLLVLVSIGVACGRACKPGSGKPPFVDDGGPDAQCTGDGGSEDHYPCGCPWVFAQGEDAAGELFPAADVLQPAVTGTILWGPRYQGVLPVEVSVLHDIQAIRAVSPCGDGFSLEMVSGQILTVGIGDGGVRLVSARESDAPDGLRGGWNGRRGWRMATRTDDAGLKWGLVQAYGECFQEDESVPTLVFPDGGARHLGWHPHGLMCGQSDCVVEWLGSVTTTQGLTGVSQSLLLQRDGGVRWSRPLVLSLPSSDDFHEVNYVPVGREVAQLDRFIPYPGTGRTGWVRLFLETDGGTTHWQAPDCVMALAAATDAPYTLEPRQRGYIRTAHGFAWLGVGCHGTTMTGSPSDYDCRGTNDPKEALVLVEEGLRARYFSLSCRLGGARRQLVVAAAK